MKIADSFLAELDTARDLAHAPFRPVACLLGLPFDVVSMEQALSRLKQAPQGAGAILSTPNVNWVMLARDHPWLRDSVLRSRLSVVDGTALVWLGRLMGIPFAERVSGSDLFVRMENAPDPTRVFFFGGMGDVAERASRCLQPRRGALQGVGGLNPGMGDVEAMSASPLLEAVRAAGAEMVVVSLGALRGQAWIMRNHRALGATWVTHLGAVVNFVAGEVRRAPAWVGKAGIEWIWRVKEEPKLWRRYGADGMRLLGMLGQRVVPYLFWQRWHAPGKYSRPASFMISGDSSARMAGSWRGEDARLLHESLAQLVGASRSDTVRLDLSGLEYLDPGVAGQLLVWHGNLLEAGGALHLLRPSTAARRLLHGLGADFLLDAN